MTIYDIFYMLGGVGLFLFGMTVMSSGLKNAAGDNLQIILEKVTSNKIIAIILGIAITVLVQSSSATVFMVIGFVNAGMMTLAQAIGVIMGANIGTTVTAQITAFNLSKYAPIILFVGTVMYIFIKKNFLKHIGAIIMGFGMLFFGVAVMKEGIEPLSDSAGFKTFLSGLNNPALAILFGFAFTALLQSISSSSVIFQAFAVQGLLSLNTSAYLLIGGAVGAVFPIMLASLTTNKDGKRTAIADLLFNLFRVVVLVILLLVFPRILDLIEGLSPTDIGRQIANTNTIFAIIAVLIIAPFSGLIIKFVEKIMPVEEEEHEQRRDRTLQYMVNISKLPASMAVSQAQKEITRMGRVASKNLHRAVECFFNYNPEKAAKVRAREESVNILNHTISDALVQLRELDLSTENMRRVSVMTIAITDIERISDHAENIIEYTEEMLSKRAGMSDDAIEELRRMSDEVLEEVDLALDIFESEDYDRLDDLEYIEDSVDAQEDMLIGNHVQRLMDGGCNPLAGVVFADIVTDLERCGDHAINIAYALKERPKELDEDRVTDPLVYMEAQVRETMKHDPLKHDAMKHDAIKRDVIKQDATKQDATLGEKKYDKDRAHD